MRIINNNQTWVNIFFLVVLLLGIFFRFANLDEKVYWHDEVYTSLRIAGYNREQVIEQVFNGQIIGVEDLLKFQRLTPEKGLKDTLDVLIEHPEHPPLYFLLARFWSQLFGSSIAAIRSLSAFFSLLVFPCLYWLCWELFSSKKIAGIAIALVAVSPFHILYAQEARQYSLWTATIILSSATLLYCLRRDKNWLLYSLTILINLYISLFSVLVIIGHFIYVIAIEGLEFNQKVTKFLGFCLAAIFLFVPWMWVIYINYNLMDNQTSWVKTNIKLLDLLTSWQLSYTNLFIDLPGLINHQIAPIFFTILFASLGYIIYCLYHQTHKTVWLFIVTLIVVTPLSLILPDVILGGIRSVHARYFVPSFIGIEIAVAYGLFNNKISKNFPLIFSMLITMGIISGSMIYSSDTWWNKLSSYENAKIARIINQTPQPLIISDSNDINVGNLISLSYLLEPKVKLLLVDEPKIPSIPAGFSDIFFYNNYKQAIEDNKDRLIQAGVNEINNSLLWKWH